MAGSRRASLLRCLSVFAGSFSLEAAENVGEDWRDYARPT